MNAELVAVGTEILLGDIDNTHAKFLSNELAVLGINVLYHTAVGDNPDRMRAVAKEAIGRSDLVIFTGGLGPTKDDLTKEIVCEIMGIPLVKDEEVVRRLLYFFKKLNREVTTNDPKQAMVPQGAKVFYNDHGTAPGLAIQKDGKAVVLLPGPPSELLPMYHEQVRDYLMSFTNSIIVSRNLNVFGFGESQVDMVLTDLLKNTNPTVATYAKESEVRVRITAKAENESACEAMIDDMLAKVNEKIGPYVYGIDADSLEQVLVGQLLERHKTIALAESCTGGLVAQKITSIPGSSGCFGYGIVSYSNQVKAHELGVQEETLNAYGAVSEQVAKEMALCAKQRGQADIGIGITGIAGPDGGSEEKPVGLVYIGVAVNGEVTAHQRFLSFGRPNERQSIRNRASMHALSLGLDALKQL